MKVEHNQLFPLTMSVYTPDYKITEQEIEFLKNVEVVIEEDHVQHVHLSKNIDILNTCPELKNIRDVMLDVAEQYKRDVLGISNELAPLYNWLAKQYEGGYHQMHDHAGALFSLVYYIKGSENARLKSELNHHSSRLQEGFNFEFNIVKTTPFNAQAYAHLPKDGEIICVPGWLHHCTEISTGFRMCIGWNFFVNGIMGKDEFSAIEINATRLDNDK